MGVAQADDQEICLNAPTLEEQLVGCNSVIDGLDGKVTAQSRANALAFRAIAYLNAGEIEDARFDALKSLAANQETLLARIVLGRVHQLEAEHQKAVQQFSEVIELREESSVFFLRGMSHAELGQYDLAVADFSAAIEGGSNSAQEYAHRGISYVRLGDIALGLADIDHAMSLGEDSDKIYAWRGHALFASKRLAEAQLAFSAAVDKGYETESVFRKRGYTFLNYGQFTEALADFDRAIELGTDQTAVWVWKVYILSKMRRPAEALAALRTVPENSVHSEKWGYAVAAEFVTRGYSREALPFLDKAILYAADDGKAHYLRGIILCALGDAEGAAASLNRANTHWPEFSEAIFESIRQAGHFVSSKDIFVGELAENVQKYWVNDRCPKGETTFLKREQK